MELKQGSILARDCLGKERATRNDASADAEGGIHASSLWRVSLVGRGSAVRVFADASDWSSAVGVSSWVPSLDVRLPGGADDDLCTDTGDSESVRKVVVDETRCL